MTGLVRAESLFRARRRERRRRAVRPVVIAAIATTVAGGAIWLGYDSPLLTLTSVSVKGTSRLTTAEVLAAARVPTGRSLLAVPVDGVRRRVLRLAPVAEVRVRRIWPHRLVIDVVERTPVAAVPAAAGAGSTVVLLDAHGVAFATQPSADAPAPGPAPGPARGAAGLLDLRVAAPALGETNPAAVAALRVWSGLPAQVRHEVQWMSARSADDVTFRLARGATVVWGTAADDAEKLAVLAALMRGPATTYDVSTPGVAVTRG